ncbi:MAG: hypothetical protein Q9225_004886 [Loekoesia sp. 1 TL-2023]
MSQTYHTVGGTHVVTRAYPSDALSSVRCVNSIGVGRTQHSVLWEPINYSDLYNPIPVSESLSRIDRCFTNRQDNDVWGDWMRKPFISLPQDVSELDPTWTTCSGVAIGAMDPPRALVPAAGWEDPPPSAPADPPSAGPITTSVGRLPKPTPGKTVPEPIVAPTPGPSKEPDPKPQPKASPNTDPSINPSGPPAAPQPSPLKPSAIHKDPSKNPAAAAPQPQQPSSNAPAGDSSVTTGIDPGHGINVQPPGEDNKPTSKQTDPQQPSNSPGEKHPDGPGALDSISGALFPTPLPKASSAEQVGNGQTGGGDSSGSGKNHPSSPNTKAGSSGKAGSNPPPSSQIEAGSQNKGSTHADLSPAETSQDQSPSSSDQAAQSGQSSSGNVSHGNSLDTQDSQTSDPKNDSGSGPGAMPGNGGSRSPSEGAVSQIQQNPQGNTAASGFDHGPTTFAFVSNGPPPLAGSHTVARALDGAAVVGTATIHPGEVQVVNSTPISVAPAAIVVGSSTYALNPPQKAITPTRAPAVAQAPDGGLVVGTKTILPGHKDTVNNHEVSVGSSNVVVDGKSFAFPAVTPPPSTQRVDVGGVQITRDSNNDIVIGGSTYKPGVQVTASGHSVSVGSGVIAVDGTTYGLPGTPVDLPLVVDGQAVRKDSNGQIIIGTSTLAPGSQVTVAGHDISVGSSTVVIDQNTYTLPKTAGTVQVPSLQGTATMAPLMIDGQFVSKDASGHLIVGTSTIPLGSQLTMADHIISAASDKVIMDHSTYILPTTAGAVETPAPTPITLPNGMVLTAGASAITVSGEVISVFSNDKGFVIDGSTVTVPSVTSSQSVFTVAGETFTATPSGFSIDGTTISLGGPAVTISGTVVSLGTAGLQIGSQTIPLPTSTASQPDLGDVIMSAFSQGGGINATAGSPGTAGTPTPTSPTGSFQSRASRSADGFLCKFFQSIYPRIILRILLSKPEEEESETSVLLAEKLVAVPVAKEPRSVPAAKVPEIVTIGKDPKSVPVGKVPVGVTVESETPVPVGNDPTVLLGKGAPVAMGKEPPVPIGKNPPLRVGKEPPVPMGNTSPVPDGAVPVAVPSDSDSKAPSLQLYREGR